MKKTWILLDVNYLAHRAFYSTGNLRTGSDATGVLYGVFREIFTQQSEHASRDIVFCFDYGKGKRYELLPTYKSTRKLKYATLTPSELELREEFETQLNKIREYYLPRLGYQNVLFAEGYEADDVIASLIINTIPETEDAIIVSSDQDLYQLLRPNVTHWNPTQKKSVSLASFSAEWGINPDQWPTVKALAGCSTDDVIGIDGVGEITAAKYLRGEMKPGGIVHNRLIEQANQTIKQNIPLVRLPFAGCPVFELKPDEVTNDRWRKLLEHLGFSSLLGDI